MTTAFVLSGGSNLGAAQIGMLAALRDGGVTPDLIVGTSVGAINGAMVAAGADPGEIAAVWRRLRRDTIFPTWSRCTLRAVVGRSNCLCHSSGIRRLLQEHLRFERLEQAPIPLHVVATDVLNGRDVVLCTGDSTEAILASIAIPGILPPVNIEGRDLIDGGVVNNTPISHAVDLGADVIWVVTTGYSCKLETLPRSALGMALHAASLAIHQRLAIDVQHYEPQVDLRVVPPLCPITIAPTDFSRSAELFDRAHAVTRDWLAAWTPQMRQERLLQPHDPPIPIVTVPGTWHRLQAVPNESLRQTQGQEQADAAGRMDET
ncbi:patatin-like phospholipase family protein [Catellatospora citrea]|uniref:patatin-like phospholipase family protein n=1 Tax=Catellatospora citrea TaxID=53366 RepID=UPI0033E44ECC